MIKVSENQTNYCISCPNGFLTARKELNAWFKSIKAPMNEYEVFRQNIKVWHEGDLDVVTVALLPGSDTEMMFKLCWTSRLVTERGLPLK